MLLYGDAVAHLHIARRIIDSLNPGSDTVGSVWLPFPICSCSFRGAHGLVAVGTSGRVSLDGRFTFLELPDIYRLARLWVQPGSALVAVLFFALNPGLLYMQTTAMNEPLFLSEMIWAVLLIVEYGRALQERRSRRCKAAFGRWHCPGSGSLYPLRRLDLCLSRMVSSLSRRLSCSKRWNSPAGGAFVLFTVMLAIAPVIWMAYCARQFGDPLDFMRGPYSAKAIELRTATPGAPHYPGWHSMPVAAIYFLKAAELGAMPLRLANRLLILSIAGSVAAAVRWRAARWTYGSATVVSAAFLCLLGRLWLRSDLHPSVVAALLVQHALWHGNAADLRAISRFSEWRCCIGLDWPRFRPTVARWIPGGGGSLIVADDAALLRAKPLVLDEAIANSRTRIPFEVAYAHALQLLPQERNYSGLHVRPRRRLSSGPVSPSSHTINETDYYQWQSGAQRSRTSLRTL